MGVGAVLDFYGIMEEIGVKMARNLLQSRAWEKYAKSEGRETIWRDGDGYEALAIVQETPLGKYLFCPYGPAITGAEKKETGEAERERELRALDFALDSLRAAARERGAFFVRIEPTVAFSEAELKERGLVKSHDIEPAHTWVIDLTQAEEEILDGIEKTKVRHWRNHGKKGITIRTSTDPEEITILASLLQKVGERDNFTPQDAKHLKGQMEAGFATLYIAEYEGKAIAASLVYDYDGVRYYAHAGADDEYKKLTAGTILLVEMIMDARRMGAKRFDFWGITTSEDPKHPWYGFTQYKKSFGGYEVDYAGTWDLPMSKMKYRIYQMIRKVNRGLRKKS